MLVFTGTRGGTSDTVPGGIGECGAPLDRAGLARLWAIPCAAVAAITFDEDRRVSAVSITCDSPDTEWQEIGFTQNSGQASQAQSGFNRYGQTVSVSIDGQDNGNRNQINALSSCSCWHFIALDNSENYHYYGIHTYDRGENVVWESSGMSATGNNAITGIAPTDGNNGQALVFTAPAVHQLAPQATGSPDRLSASCTDTNNCGPLVLTTISGECLTNIALENLEII